MGVNILKDNSLKNDKVICVFLSDPENKRLYEKVIESNRGDLMTELNEKFKGFYLEIKLRKYISTIIHNSVVELDIRNRNKAPFLDSYDPAVHDKLSTETLDVEEANTSFEDEFLSKAFQSLTNKEKMVIILTYLKELKESEISKGLNITQQAVSKTKHRALKKLREKIRKGER